MSVVSSVFKKMNMLGAQGVPFVFLIDFEKQQGRAIPVSALKNEIQYEIDGVLKKPNPEFYLEKHPLPFRTYETQFKKAEEAFQKGEVSYLNLTAETPIDTNLSLPELFHYSRAKYKILYRDEFVCFSPETFVQVKDNTIYSYPMKGTIAATTENAAQQILENPKEIEEHSQTIELLKKDLRKVASQIRVNRFRYLIAVNTHQGPLLQVSSEVSGSLPRNWQNQIGSIFDQLLPAGSICGAPKKHSFDLIRNIETHHRNFYTGVFGIFDGTEVDSTVLIRYIEKTKHGLVYKSGGGITRQSDAEKEYQELITKVYVPIY